MGKKKPQQEETAMVVGKLDGIVETKLTKSEAINLIIDDMENKARSRLKEIDEEMRDIQLSLPKDKLRKFALERVSFRIRFPYSKHDNKVAIETSYQNLKDEDLPDWLATARDRYMVLLEEKYQLDKVLQAMQEKDKARNYILRHSLQASDAGKELLRIIETFSVGLTSQLLLAAADEKK